VSAEGLERPSSSRGPDAAHPKQEVLPEPPDHRRGDVRIEEIAPPSWRERLGGAWDRLLLEASDPTIFLSFPWIESWWRNFGSRLAPRALLRLGLSGRFIAAAPPCA